jgi:hypothetical protein
MNHAMNREAVLLRWAAECDVLMNLASDPKDKQIYKRLRDTWIALAHNAPTSSPISSYEIIDADIAAIKEAQFVFGQGSGRSIH